MKLNRWTASTIDTLKNGFNPSEAPNFNKAKQVSVSLTYFLMPKRGRDECFLTERLSGDCLKDLSDVFALPSSLPQKLLVLIQTTLNWLTFFIRGSDTF